jgi:hypothetical protein
MRIAGPLRASVAALLLVAMGGMPAAFADSATGQAGAAGQNCVDQVPPIAANGANVPVPTITNVGQLPQLPTVGPLPDLPAAALACAIGGTEPATSAAADAALEANNRVIEAQALAANPGSVVAPIAGSAISVAASTVALQFSLTTDYLNQGITITPVVLGGVRAAVADTPDGFKYNNTDHLYWDPNQDSGSNGHLDGIQTFNMYNQAKRYVSDFDFWATSNVASVTPLKGSHLTHLDAEVAPNDNLELVASDPNAVNPYGNAGSRTIDASLHGEWSAGADGGPGGGGSVGLSETWQWNVGYAGGGILHNEEHYGEWDLDKGQDNYAKAVQGVETWKVPINEGVWWMIGGYAHWHS